MSCCDVINFDDRGSRSLNIFKECTESSSIIELVFNMKPSGSFPNRTKWCGMLLKDEIIHDFVAFPRTPPTTTCTQRCRFAKSVEMFINAFCIELLFESFKRGSTLEIATKITNTEQSFISSLTGFEKCFTSSLRKPSTILDQCYTDLFMCHSLFLNT